MKNTFHVSVHDFAATDFLSSFDSMKVMSSMKAILKQKQTEDWALWETRVICTYPMGRIDPVKRSLTGFVTVKSQNEFKVKEKGVLFLTLN